MLNKLNCKLLNSLIHSFFALFFSLTSYFLHCLFSPTPSLFLPFLQCPLFLFLFFIFFSQYLVYFWALHCCACLIPHGTSYSLHLQDIMGFRGVSHPISDQQQSTTQWSVLPCPSSHRSAPPDVPACLYPRYTTTKLGGWSQPNLGTASFSGIHSPNPELFGCWVRRGWQVVMFLITSLDKKSGTPLVCADWE